MPARPDVALDVVCCKLNSCVYTLNTHRCQKVRVTTMFYVLPLVHVSAYVRTCVCASVRTCVCELVMKPKPKWVSVSCSIPFPFPALLHSLQHCGHIFVHRECHFHVLLRIRDVGHVERPHSVNSCRLCVYSS